MSDWQRYLDDNRGRFLEELTDFLRIPSVSALPEHAGDVRRAGEWVVRRMEKAGIEHVRLLETAGHPVVYGDWLHAGDRPTVLVYGHFDVQPADPFELWTSPPFEPRVEDGRLYARGASDDKGNMLIPILAVEALLETAGTLPVNLKLLFEGQEEIGSPDLPPFLTERRDELACDLILSADGGQFSEDRPGLFVGFKGLSGLQVDVKGPKMDLHSGVWGGAVANPIHALSHILDTMHDDEGRITVEGFHDGVVPLTNADREEIAAAPYDEAGYKAHIGVDALFGETGYTTYERAWARPTLEVNGVWGGFQGAGLKTVLPSEAHAKITCRLVPGQVPERVLEAIARHVEANAPPGVRAKVHLFPGGSPAYLIPREHPGNRAAAEVLEALYGTRPVISRSGGTLPICSLFQEILGVYTVIFAFALDDENFHSPDEFFRLASFDRGQRAYCLLLERLGERGL